MLRPRSLVYATLLCLQAGCQTSDWQWPQWRWPGTQDADEWPPLTDSPFIQPATEVPAPPALTRVHLQFEVKRIELPAEGERHSEKIWNHVDEMQLEPALVALLARNGLRAGVASSSAWPAVETIVTSEGGTTDSYMTVVQPGFPLWIGLGSIEGSETLFTFERDGRMVGTTYAHATKALRIDYETTLQDDEIQITLVVMPEIHEEENRPKWTMEDGEYKLSKTANRHVFSGLSAEWLLDSSQVLVIGPDVSPNVGRRVGDRFLTYENAGKRRDMILCLVPKPFRLAR